MIVFALVSYNLQKYFNASVDIYIPIATICTIALSYLSYILFEKTSIKLGYKITNAQYVIKTIQWYLKNMIK